MLKDHTLIYDDECPACGAYTQLFVDTKMIAPSGRQAYGKMLHVLEEKIDWVRAANEIALVNHKTGEVSYGVDSLFQIIVQRFPFFQPLFRSPVFSWLMTKLYFFISFNRKVIMPGKTFEVCSKCAPSMNYPYRIAYLLLSWLLTSVVLVAYSHLLSPLVPNSSFGREFLFCGGQMLFQGLLLVAYDKQKLIYYLGNMMTVSLGGALLLLPMLLISTWWANPWVAVAYFFLVVGLMLIEHIRRVKILGLPWHFSASWVLYRLLLLLLIF